MKLGEVQISYRDIPSDKTKKKKFELPYNYFQDASKYNILDNLKGSTKPKLFFLGTHDKLVSPEIVRKAFKASPEPKMLYELDSEHDYRKHPKIIEEVNKVAGKFLDKYS